jgi:streptogramin lyase
MGDNGSARGRLSIRKHPFLYGVASVLAIAALIVQPWGRVVPSFVQDWLNGAVSEPVELFYADADPVLAHELAFSVDTASVLSLAYLLDSVDADDLDSSLADLEAVGIGTVSSSGWQIEGQAAQAVTSADGSNIHFTMRSPEFGEGVARLDPSDGSLTFWPLPGSADVDGVTEFDDVIYAASGTPTQLHRLDIDEGRATVLSLTEERSDDGASPFPDPGLVVWTFESDEGEAGGVMHPRLGPDGQVYYSSHHGGIGVMDLEGEQGRFWGFTETFADSIGEELHVVNGLAIDEHGMVYGAPQRSVFGRNFGLGLVRLDPATGELEYWAESEVGDFEHITSSGDKLYMTSRQGITELSVAEPGRVSRWPVRQTRDIHVGTDGSLYFTTRRSVGVLDPQTGQLTEWPLRQSQVVGIYVDETAEQIYFADQFGRRIGRVDARTNRLAEWHINERPLHVKQGSDGNIYYANPGRGGWLGVLDPSQPGDVSTIVPDTETITRERSLVESTSLPAISPTSHEVTRSTPDAAFEEGRDEGTYELELPGSPHDLTPGAGFVGADMALVFVEALDTQRVRRTRVTAEEGGVVHHTNEAVALMNSPSGPHTFWSVGEAVASGGVVNDAIIGSDGHIYAAVENMIVKVPHPDADSQAQAWPISDPQGEDGSITRIAADDGRIWFLNSSEDTVGFLDVATNSVRELSDLRQPTDIDLGDHLLVVLHRNDYVTILPNDERLDDVLSSPRNTEPKSLPRVQGSRRSLVETEHQVQGIELPVQQEQVVSEARMATGVQLTSPDLTGTRAVTSGLVAADGSLFPVPALSDIDAMAPEVAGFEFADSDLAAMLAASEAALTAQIATAMESETSLVDRSWATFEDHVPFAPAAEPDEDRDLLLLGPDERSLFTLFEFAGLADTHELALLGQGEATELSPDAASEAHLEFIEDLLVEASPGAQAILEGLLPVVLPHLPALQGEPDFADLVANFRSAVLDLKWSASSRFAGDDRRAALQDVAFELSLNLRRLGAGSMDIASLSPAIEQAHDITSEYLQALERPVPPLAKLSAHLGSRHEEQPFDDRLAGVLREMTATLHRIVHDSVEIVAASGDEGEHKLDARTHEALSELLKELEDERSESVGAYGRQAWANELPSLCDLVDIVGDQTGRFGEVAALVGTGEIGDPKAAFDALKDFVGYAATGQYGPRFTNPKELITAPYNSAKTAREMAERYGLGNLSHAIGLLGGALCGRGIVTLVTRGTHPILCFALAVAGDYLKVIRAMEGIPTEFGQDLQARGLTCG